MHKIGNNSIGNCLIKTPKINGFSRKLPQYNPKLNGFYKKYVSIIKINGEFSMILINE